MIGVSRPHPSNAIGMVEVVPELTIREELARTNQIAQLRNRLLGVLACTSVQVTPENARISVGSKQDQAVCDGLERGIDPAFERLADLSVVVVD